MNSEEIVKSDITFVQDNIIKINSNLSQLIIDNSSSLFNFNNTRSNEVYANFNMILRKYYICSNELNKTINKEINNINNIAIHYEKLDNKLSEEAGNL